MVGCLEPPKWQKRDGQLYVSSIIRHNLVARAKRNLSISQAEYRSHSLLNLMRSSMHAVHKAIRQARRLLKPQLFLQCPLLGIHLHQSGNQRSPVLSQPPRLLRVLCVLFCVFSFPLDQAEK